MILVALFLAGCASTPVCATKDEVLAATAGDALRCEEGHSVIALAELLSGRTQSDRRQAALRKAVRGVFVRDPVDTRARLERVARIVEELSTMTGPQVAEMRSTRLWEEISGKGVFSVDDGAVGTALRDAVSVWTKDDGEHLAMTEIDVEGLIRFGSLCREAQGGAPLNISIADRVGIYDAVEKRFHAGDRHEKVSMLAIGAFFWALRDRWASATYEEQQAWIAKAPLPPPMTAGSLEYLNGVLAGDLRGHAAELHAVLGPLMLRPAPKELH